MSGDLVGEISGDLVDFCKDQWEIDLCIAVCHDRGYEIGFPLYTTEVIHILDDIMTDDPNRIGQSGY